MLVEVERAMDDVMILHFLKLCNASTKMLFWNICIIGPPFLLEWLAIGRWVLRREHVHCRALELEVGEACHKRSFFRFKRWWGCAMSTRGNIKSMIDNVTFVTATRWVFLQLSLIDEEAKFQPSSFLALIITNGILSIPFINNVAVDEVNMTFLVFQMP